MTIIPFTTEPLGRAIDDYLSHQDMQRFPEGSAPYQRATEEMVALAPALIQLMQEHGVVMVRTKTATAEISDDGKLTVKRYEVAV